MGGGWGGWEPWAFVTRGPFSVPGTVDKHSVEVTNCFSVPHNESEDEVSGICTAPAWSPAARLWPLPRHCVWGSNQSGLQNASSQSDLLSGHSVCHGRPQPCPSTLLGFPAS